jgi:hypothetical protein
VCSEGSVCIGRKEGREEWREKIRKGEEMDFIGVA